MKIICGFHNNNYELSSQLKKWKNVFDLDELKNFADLEAFREKYRIANALYSMVSAIFIEENRGEWRDGEVKAIAYNEYYDFDKEIYVEFPVWAIRVRPSLERKNQCDYKIINCENPHWKISLNERW